MSSNEEKRNILESLRHGDFVEIKKTLTEETFEGRVCIIDNHQNVHNGPQSVEVFVFHNGEGLSGGKPKGFVAGGGFERLNVSTKVLRGNATRFFLNTSFGEYYSKSYWLGTIARPKEYFDYNNGLDKYTEIVRIVRSDLLTSIDRLLSK